MVLSSQATAQGSTRADAAAAMRTLITWAATVKVADIPDAILRRAALVLSDNLAATVAAESEPEVQAAQEKLTERSTATEATVFNRRVIECDPACKVLNGSRSCPIRIILVPCHYSSFFWWFPKDLVVPETNRYISQ